MSTHTHAQAGTHRHVFTHVRTLLKIQVKVNRTNGDNSFMSHGYDDVSTFWY